MVAILCWNRQVHQPTENRIWKQIILSQGTVTKITKITKITKRLYLCLNVCVYEVKKMHEWHS